MMLVAPVAPTKKVKSGLSLKLWLYELCANNAQIWSFIADVNLLFGVFREIVYMTQRKIKVNILT